MIGKIRSLSDLRERARTDRQYERLALVAASNLGGTATTLNGALRWLWTNAEETDEAGVVAEVNACRDLAERGRP